MLILKPDTLLRRHRQGFTLFWCFKSGAPRGRLHLSEDLVSLIERMASENPLWGAERIRGELPKLGLHIAKDTIQTYLPRIRPTRSPSQDWNTFLKYHAKEVWVCDFLPVIDMFFRQVFVFFIIELGSRRVVLFGVTRHPTGVGVAQQLREATPYGAAPRFLVRDNDSKIGQEFTLVANSTGIEVLRTPYRAPRAKAVCERFMGSVRRECLEHMLILTERQLYRAVREYVPIFNAARPHQGIQQTIPQKFGSNAVAKRERKIIAFPILDGLHHDYQWGGWEHRNDGDTAPQSQRGYSDCRGQHGEIRHAALDWRGACH